MYPIIRSDLFDSDLESILDNVNDFSPTAANRLADEVEAMIERIQHLPKIGLLKESYGPQVRSKVIQPYVLFYRFDEQSIHVLRLIHGSRDIDSIMSDDTE